MNTGNSRAGAVVRGLLLVLAGVALSALVFLNPFGLPLPWGHRHEVSGAASGQPATRRLWTCGMHPQVMQDTPGTCPICHMDLTPLDLPGSAPAGDGPQILFYRHPSDPMTVSPVPAKDEAGNDYQPVFAEAPPPPTGPVDAGPEVILEPGLIQRMNVTTTPVERADLVRSVSTVGIVEFDHELETTVTVKFRGYVEHVHVHLVGQKVRKGQALFDVYSPELVQTQQDLLSALAYAKRMEASGATSADARRRAQDLVGAARERLRLWDISPSQIQRVEQEGKVARVLTVTAPASGVITRQLESLAGMEVSPGMGIYTITDVSRAWIAAELYEDQIASVRSQERASVRVDAFPGEVLEARVLAIEPWVERETRTVQVTLGLDNPGGRLRQGMYVNVDFEPVVSEGALLLPPQSILRTGTRNVVIVAKGEGRFAPRDVVLGQESAGRVEILSGLEEGEQVVTSAQFLIDSESSLKAAVQAMISAAVK